MKVLASLPFLSLQLTFADIEFRYEDLSHNTVRIVRTVWSDRVQPHPA